MMSDYYANILINWSLRNQALTPPVAVYLGLFKALFDPTVNPPTSEVSGGAYARQLITFGAAANGRTLNTAAVVFPNPTADWGTTATPIIAIAIMEQSSGGNWMMAYHLCKPRIVLNGDPAPRFEINAIKVNFRKGMLNC